jgi:serine/threonine-protein kinase
MEPVRGLLVADKYRLERLLAKGGMGSVWAAIHEKLDARVAVKFMDPNLAFSEDMKARFQREAIAAAQLRSPHVVQVLDYGIELGSPYIVMELLEGEDLRARLKRRGSLSLREASTIVVQTSKALRLAASAGLVHRDLKPGNIFLAESGDDEVVKILDFGVAKAMHTVGESTSAGLLLGSPHYMSPEQARGMPLDHRSDLFSMAVILFEMITSRRPFPGSEVGDVIVRICTEPVPKMSQVGRGLPEELDAFFERAMARDREQRFQSARAMAEEFAAIVGGHLGEAIPRPISSQSPVSTEDPSWPSAQTAFERTPVSLMPGSSRWPAPIEMPPTETTLATRNLIEERPRRSWVSVVAVVSLLIVAGAVWSQIGGAVAVATTGLSQMPNVLPPEEAKPPEPEKSEPADKENADAEKAVAEKTPDKPAVPIAPLPRPTKKPPRKRQPTPAPAAASSAPPDKNPVLGI